MRYAAFALLALVGCVSQDGRRSPLLPTEFHLFGSRSWADSSGDIGPRGDPNWNLDTSGSSDGYAIGAGFTWLIGPVASSPAMHDLVRELKYQRATAAPAPVVVVPVPVLEVDPDDDPDHVHEPGQGPTGPVPVVVEGANDSIWIPLIGALSLLATAVAGYLGRERIPGVRRYTARGRATSAACDLEDDDAPQA